MSKQINFSINVPTGRGAWLPVGLILGGALAFGVNSMAEDSELDAGPRVIPYNGVLEFNGAPFEGFADIEFTLTNEGDCVDTHEVNALPIQAGRFSTNIGQGVGVNPCVFDSEVVTIGIAVRDPAVLDDMDPSNDGFIPLAGSQRIHPVPFSYWAAEGADFKVDGTLNVESLATFNADADFLGADNAIRGLEGVNPDGTSLAVGGTLVVDNINGLSTINSGGNLVQMGGNLTLGSTADTGDGNLNLNGYALQLGVADDRDRGTSGMQRALIHGDNDVLIINRAGDFEGGVQIESAVEISGDISDPDGPVVINDGLQLLNGISDSNGPVVINDDDGLHVAGGTIKGQLELDTQNRIISNGSDLVQLDCPDNSFPISCMATGRSNVENGPDVVDCNISVANSRCTFARYANGGDDDFAASCVCLKTQ